jgi:hypothetical protein
MRDLIALLFDVVMYMYVLANDAWYALYTALG